MVRARGSFNCAQEFRQDAIPVGVSLLAMAILHPTFLLTDTPLSRAGSLLQFDVCSMQENRGFRR
ncbi:hypothetical protein EMIT0232MI5_50331 [Pseudomonas sp. IT-232MI5]